MDTSSKNTSNETTTVETTTTKAIFDTSKQSVNTDNVTVNTVISNEPKTDTFTSTNIISDNNYYNSRASRPRIISIAPNGAFWANDGYDDYYFDENGDEC